ncbi:MAG: methyltransferase family protein [Novosphingobium sp.]
MTGSASPIAASRRAYLLRPGVLDRIEQVVILLVFSLFAWRMLNAPNAYAPAVMISETAVVLFTLIRRPTEAISLRLGDWLLATTATLAPLLIIPNADPYPALAGLGLFLIFFGNFFQAWAKLILRRSFGITPANRGVKITGAYRFVRHPMYAGYLLVHIGVLAVMFSPYNMAIYAIGWTAQILRLLAEERLLGEDPAYRDYMTQVRWRLIPGAF